MNKVYIVAGAAAAGVAYIYFMKKKPGPAVATAKPAAEVPVQPSQAYPWSPIAPVRADNANQPWYNGPPLQVAANTIKGVGEVANSVKDAWQSLSNLFGGSDDAKSNLQAPPQTEAMNEDWQQYNDNMGVA